MERAAAVLVIDDDADVLRAARLALAPAALRIDCLTSPDDIDAAIAGASYEVMLLDMNFAAGANSGRAGLDILDRIAAADPTLAVVLMTAYGGVTLAVEALKRGAADFVLKPWRNEKLVEAVAAAAALTRSRRAAAAPLQLSIIEKHAIERALARHDGNIAQAAAALGLTRPALYRRMAKHGL